MSSRSVHFYMSWWQNELMCTLNIERIPDGRTFPPARPHSTAPIANPISPPAFIQLLDNDDLFASLTALEDDGDLCSKNTSIPQFKPPPPPNYHIPSRACILDQTFSKIAQSRGHSSLPLTILINDEELDYDYLEYERPTCVYRQRPWWLY